MRTILSVQLVSLIVILCGCNGSSSNRAPTLRIAATRGSLLFFPLHLAQSLGYFEQEGVRVSLDEVVSAPKSMQSLLGGSSDIVGTGFLAGILMYEEHRPVQSFFLLVQDPGYVALVSPRTARRIRKVEDLRGATVGISSPGSDQQQILNLILTRHGLRPDDIKVVGVGAGMSHAKALEQGAIDVGTAFGTTVAVIQKLYPNISTLFDLRLPEQRRQHLGLEHVPHSVLLAKSNWMRDHPDAVRRIAHATLRAVEWSRAHTAEDIRKRLPGSMRTEDAAVDTERSAPLLKCFHRTGCSNRSMSNQDERFWQFRSRHSKEPTWIFPVATQMTSSWEYNSDDNWVPGAW